MNELSTDYNVIKTAALGDLATLISAWDQMPAYDRSFTLAMAASHGQRAIVSWLLEHGVDPAGQAETLVWTSKQGWPDLVQTMLQRGSDPLYSGSLAFRYACQHGHLETAQVLAPHSEIGALQEGALIWAAEKRQETVVDWLLNVRPEGAQVAFDRLLFSEDWTTLDFLACRVPMAQTQAWLDTLEGRHLPLTAHRVASAQRHQELVERPSPPAVRSVRRRS